ncbi:hypothetical protein [Fortiea contorta]|uniref:hypothetical protein n=1 Tax=Fortiea contorta TaxID=1892405 RepID=UPI00034CB740|nr:hypothetical protein [Fortiea contorta]
MVDDKFWSKIILATLISIISVACDAKAIINSQPTNVRVNLDKPAIGTEIISEQIEQEAKKTTFGVNQN